MEARVTQARISTRRRSPERRVELAAAAAELFFRRGYHRVSVADVAAAVGVTAPAVYRHHAGKQALLAAAVHSGLDVAEAALEEGGDLDRVLENLAGAALERRDVWVLLSRELRFLAPESRDEVQRRVDGVAHVLDEAVVAERPAAPAGDRRLLVTAALAVLSAPSLWQAQLPRAEYRRELARVAAAVCRAELSQQVPEAPARPARRRARHRGEELLEVAIELFHERSYDAVSLDDIGAVVGIAGPSIYHHFPTKADILVAAFSRATESLSRSGSAPAPVDARSVLAERVADYTALGIDQRALFGVYVSEAIHLPPEAGRRINAALRADFEDWVSALRACTPALDADQCTLRVGAARSIVNDLVRLGRFHARPAISAEIRQLALVAMSSPAG
ncbi:TetR family transcriptional regulator [Pseudonocardia sp. NPDC049154]|uniref:TetR/AcrR family transcriptional regulator n=1 Tax=Pseudonocardia sp. NPDC049154 TaxID=3155501 RepID=UPI0033DF0FB1